MKLEEVLPHLRNGGKIMYLNNNGFYLSYSIDNIFNSFTPKELLNIEWELVKEPYKITGERIPNIQYDGSYAIVVTVPDPSKKYSYIIEEITK